MNTLAPLPPPETAPAYQDVGSTADRLRSASSRLIRLALQYSLEGTPLIIEESFAKKSKHGRPTKEATILRLPPLPGENPEVGPHIELEVPKTHKSNSHSHGKGHHHAHPITTSRVWMTDGKVAASYDKYGDPKYDKSGNLIGKDSQTVIEAGSIVDKNHRGKEVLGKVVSHQVITNTREPGKNISHFSLPGHYKLDSPEHARSKALERTLDLKAARHEAAKILWHGYKEVRNARRPALQARAGELERKRAPIKRKLEKLEARQDRSVARQSELYEAAEMPFKLPGMKIGRVRPHMEIATELEARKIASKLRQRRINRLSKRLKK